MTQQKLNLLQFPSGKVTKPRAPSTEVVRSKLRNSSATGRSLVSSVRGPGTEGLSLACVVLLFFAGVPYSRPPVPRAQYGPRKRRVRSRNPVCGKSPDLPRVQSGLKWWWTCPLVNERPCLPAVRPPSVIAPTPARAPYRWPGGTFPPTGRGEEKAVTNSTQAFFPMFSITFTFENAGPLQWGGSLKLRGDPHRESMPAPHQFETIRFQPQPPAVRETHLVKNMLPMRLPISIHPRNPHKQKVLTRHKIMCAHTPLFASPASPDSATRPSPNRVTVGAPKTLQNCHPNFGRLRNPHKPNTLIRCKIMRAETPIFPSPLSPWHRHSCLCVPPAAVYNDPKCVN